VGSSEHLCRANWRSLDRGLNRAEESDALRAEVKSLIAERKQKIVLNMEHVECIDSAGLGMLVAAQLSAKTHGTLLCLCHLSAKFEEVLRITKLAAVFQICSTEATAKASHQQQTQSILSN
jgi:anti-anti-sigma factor